MVASKEVRDIKRKEIRDAVLTTSEATELIGKSRMRLNQFVNEGRIEQIKRGIFLKDDILAFIESREEKVSK